MDQWLNIMLQFLNNWILEQKFQVEIVKTNETWFLYKNKVCMSIFGMYLFPVNLSYDLLA